MSNKIKRVTDPLKTAQTKAVKIVNSESSGISESAEAKALQRISAMEQENNVEWVVVEPNESIDVQTVRERIQKRGYEVST